MYCCLGRVSNADRREVLVIKIAYLVLTGMRMLFRVQVLGIFPASASEVTEFDRLGGDELAWYCGADAFVGDNGREEVDDCDGWCLCLMS